ncbi:MAG: sugar phosphate nucleotidyltransferase [Hyphomonadaceae bacterium]
MAVTKIIPVIMSGGSGTRLWPLSTGERPKQFHQLGAPRTMIEETALRLSGRHGEIEFLPPVIIAGAGHRELVAELLAQAGVTPSAVVLEPEGRNTAATAALAAFIAAEIDPGAYVLLVPADHLVARPDALMAAIQAAVPVVSDRIVTFGIKPTGPETGYGYILQADAISPGVHHLAEFKEKPDLSVAEQYYRDGRYSWNSGMFFFSPALLLEEFAIAAADIRDGAREALVRAERKGRDILLHGPSFAAVRKEAVDRAVMEKTRRAAVAPCDIGWADVGSWAELWRLSDKDASGNAVSGPVTIVGSDNNLIRSEGIQISALGVSDLIIVAHGNSVLVMPRSLAQDVKKVIPDQS